ncbi:hypothetical protein AB434_0188 [Heyndrickxia coagulans]|uniref:Uncharacterized protein n=1 Tax=Heyndrickxia coagulans TaxID=1398 RepID=A0AAN0T4R5_HEYCO|nr:hypothetical protein SB48_HM08orf01514 [Heyndrickxia coagulans]AKN52593.1 hypothetical protein AB434_0188 [Heyndrickxia coagulans]
MWLYILPTEKRHPNERVSFFFEPQRAQKKQITGGLIR